MKKVRVLVVGLICICLIVGYYVYLSNRNNTESDKVAVNRTEVEKILEDNDVEEDYPKTPRAVVKLYNRIITSYYRDEYTDKQFLKMGDMQRALLDEELLSNNERDVYFNNLRLEIKQYKEAKRKIESWTVNSTNDVIYKVIDKRECAYVTSSYFIKEGSSYKKTYQRYVLRKDDDEKWKILVFYVIEGEKKDD